MPFSLLSVRSLLPFPHLPHLASFELLLLTTHNDSTPAPARAKETHLSFNPHTNSNNPLMVAFFSTVAGAGVSCYTPRTRISTSTHIAPATPRAIHPPSRWNRTYALSPSLSRVLVVLDFGRVLVRASAIAHCSFFDLESRGVGAR